MGAEVGVGLSEGLRGTGLNWRVLVKTFAGWVIAFFSAAVICAAIFSMGVFAPSINDLDAFSQYVSACLHRCCCCCGDAIAAAGGCATVALGIPRPAFITSPVPVRPPWWC